jgi:hypothetical protein
VRVVYRLVGGEIGFLIAVGLPIPGVAAGGALGYFGNRAKLRQGDKQERLQT